MKTYFSYIAVALCLTAAGCGGGSSHDVFLVGQVYDGATGTRLTTYKMTVRFRDQTLTADVDMTGRFIVRNLPVYQDYSVEIAADGYRAFRSHNGMFNIPNPGAQNAGSQPTTQTFYFDAYLFPSALVAQAVTLNVRKGLATGEPASGKVRIRPISSSLLTDNPTEIPAGVGVQVWANDEDIQAKPIFRDFTGTITIDAGELIYGVTYQINIYEVLGFQPFQGGIVAGVDSGRTFILTEEIGDPLTILSNTAAGCRGPTRPDETQTAVMSFEFNQNIELAAATTPGGFPEMVDNNFVLIAWSDTNGNLAVNTQVAPGGSATVQERGTTTTLVGGRTLTFAWNPNIGLQTKDLAMPGDLFGGVRWSVGNVEVQPVGKPSQKRSLGAIPPNPNFVNCP